MSVLIRIMTLRLLKMLWKKISWSWLDLASRWRLSMMTLTTMRFRLHHPRMLVPFSRLSPSHPGTLARVGLGIQGMLWTPEYIVCTQVGVCRTRNIEVSQYALNDGIPRHYESNEP